MLTAARSRKVRSLAPGSFFDHSLIKADMKNKALKKLFIQTLIAIGKSLEREDDEVYVLNEEENEGLKGGQVSCPRLDTKSCNPYGDCNGNCDVNFRRKEKKKKKK